MNKDLEIKRIKILFFIGTLRAGGKERRLVELLTYLKNTDLYEMEIIFTSYEIHYSDFFLLGIPYQVIQKSFQKYDPSVVYKFYQLCKNKRPDIIHSWGRVQSFYTLPTVLGLKIPLVNSQITSAPPHASKFSFENVVNQIIFNFSTFILSNSNAGLRSFAPPKGKSKLIYNGINLNRFENLPDKEKIKIQYNIRTPYAIVMIASISAKKDYELFFRTAINVLKIRTDITFVGAGAFYDGDPLYKKVLNFTRKHPNILFAGRIDDVEALVNACDIGILLSPKGEGISNTILEYMALGKPVIANDIGGNPEVIFNNINGYLIEKPTVYKITRLIIDLINDKEKREIFGQASKKIIKDKFTIEKMGAAFEEIYQLTSDIKIINKGLLKQHKV